MLFNHVMGMGKRPKETEFWNPLIWKPDAKTLQYV